MTSEEAGSEKPHQIMFLSALNKLNLKPDEALMVGDNTVTDIEGANAVGIDTVLFGRSPKRHKEDYRRPCYTVKDLSDILDLLKTG